MIVTAYLTITLIILIIGLVGGIEDIRNKQYPRIKMYTKNQDKNIWLILFIIATIKFLVLLSHLH